MYCLNIIAKLDRIIAIKVANCVFINVYFPVINCVSYVDIMTELLAIIDGIISENLGCSIILGGILTLNLSMTYPNVIFLTTLLRLPG